MPLAVALNVRNNPFSLQITMSKLAIPAHEQKILSKMHPQVEQVC